MQIHTSIFAAFAAVAILAGASLVTAQNWPTYLGNVEKAARSPGAA